MKSLKLKSYPGENDTDYCAAILVDLNRLESFAAFNPAHLGYMTCIFEDTSDYILRLWAIHKYKEVTDFIKKFRVCNRDVISQEDIITYESLLQYATQEYRDLVDSKRWETAISKEKYQDQPSLLKSYTMALEQLINKALNQVYFRRQHSGNVSDYGRGPSARSYIT